MKSDSEEQGIRELMHISIGMVKIKKKNDLSCSVMVQSLGRDSAELSRRE